MASNQWYFLSPHLDDAVLSCGGIIWELTHAGNRVETWTIFSGDPPAGELTSFAVSLHKRWGIEYPSISDRRREDLIAVSSLGAMASHFNLPECIYRQLPESRRALVQTEDDLWQPIHPEEQPLVQELAKLLEDSLPTGANLVCPLGIGGHVDHRLTRTAAQSLQCPLFFYAEYPYSARGGDEIQSSLETTWQTYVVDISPQAQTAWEDAVAAYTTQISTFWNSLEQMRGDIYAYWLDGGGKRLWYAGTS